MIFVLFKCIGRLLSFGRSVSVIPIFRVQQSFRVSSSAGSLVAGSFHVFLSLFSLGPSTPGFFDRLFARRYELAALMCTEIYIKCRQLWKPRDHWIFTMWRRPNDDSFSIWTNKTLWIFFRFAWAQTDRVEESVSEYRTLVDLRKWYVCQKALCTQIRKSKSHTFYLMSTKLATEIPGPSEYDSSIKHTLFAISSTYADNRSTANKNRLLNYIRIQKKKNISHARYLLEHTHTHSPLPYDSWTWIECGKRKEKLIKAKEIRSICEYNRWSPNNLRQYSIISIYCAKCMQFSSR